MKKMLRLTMTVVVCLSLTSCKEISNTPGNFQSVMENALRSASEVMTGDGSYIEPLFRPGGSQTTPRFWDIYMAWDENDIVVHREEKWHADPPKYIGGGISDATWSVPNSLNVPTNHLTSSSVGQTGSAQSAAAALAGSRDGIVRLGLIPPYEAGNGTAKISSLVGWRDYNRPQFHNGIDMTWSSTAGTPIVSIDTGIIQRVHSMNLSPMSGYGLLVEVEYSSLGAQAGPAAASNIMAQVIGDVTRGGLLTTQNCNSLHDIFTVYSDLTAEVADKVAEDIARQRMIDASVATYGYVNNLTFADTRTATLLTYAYTLPPLPGDAMTADLWTLYNNRMAFLAWHRTCQGGSGCIGQLELEYKCIAYGQSAGFIMYDLTTPMNWWRIGGANDRLGSAAGNIENMPSHFTAEKWLVDKMIADNGYVSDSKTIINDWTKHYRVKLTQYGFEGDDAVRFLTELQSRILAGAGEVEAGPSGTVTVLYAHLHSIGVNPRTGRQWVAGDQIKRGEVLGTEGGSGAGSTVNSTSFSAYGVHLHITMYAGGWTSLGALGPDGVKPDYETMTGQSGHFLCPLTQMGIPNLAALANSSFSTLISAHSSKESSISMQASKIGAERARDNKNRWSSNGDWGYVE